MRLNSRGYIPFMSTIIKIISLLADGYYHSGEALGKAVGVTRSGIWKQIQQLPEMGIPVESVHGKGYRIPDGLELYDAALLQNGLSLTAQDKLDGLEILPVIESTNTYLLDKAKAGERRCLAVFAEQQTAGKGRHGKQWLSPFGCQIALSVLWHFKRDSAALSGLSLATAVAAVEALRQCELSSGLALKWPNDIFWQDKKLGGILLEFVGESHGYCSVVAGIGLNVRLPSDVHQQISQEAVDFNQATAGRARYGRNQLAATLLDKLLLLPQRFVHDGFDAFLESFRQLNYLSGRVVTVDICGQRHQGQVIDVNEHGALLIRLDNGQVKAVNSGEVNLIRSVVDEPPCVCRTTD